MGVNQASPKMTVRELLERLMPEWVLLTSRLDLMCISQQFRDYQTDNYKLQLHRICRNLRPQKTHVKGGALPSLYVNTWQVFSGHMSSALIKGSCWGACQYFINARWAWTRNWFWISLYPFLHFDPTALHTKKFLVNTSDKHACYFWHVIIPICNYLNYMLLWFCNKIFFYIFVAKLFWLSIL